MESKYDSLSPHCPLLPSYENGKYLNYFSPWLTALSKTTNETGFLVIVYNLKRYSSLLCDDWGPHDAVNKITKAMVIQFVAKTSTMALVKFRPSE